MGVRMKTAIAIVLVMTVATGSAVTPSAGIQRVGWLQGCWELEKPGGTVEEHWMAPRGNSMVGVSRTVRDDRLAGFELVVIREHDDRLAYEAYPSGQPSAVFLSISISDSSVVFENPEHDFPQRIGYQFSAPGSLLGWIEGQLNDARRRIEFSYQRTACPGS